MYYEGYFGKEIAEEKWSSGSQMDKWEIQLEAD